MSARAGKKQTNFNMSIEEKANAPEVLQRVIWIQTLTLIWMSVETVVSLGTAWIARSPAVLAAMIMPWLAAQKRHLSITTASAALRADAAESAVCGYLALIALAGLVVNAVWKVSWADPVAALALLPLIIREAREAWKGKPCCH